MTRPALTDLPHPDRWAAAELRIKQLEARGTHAGHPSRLTRTHLVSRLAEVHGVTEPTMLRQLRAAGAIPIRIGKEWVLRETALLEFLETLEREAAEALPPKPAARVA